MMNIVGHKMTLVTETGGRGWTISAIYAHEQLSMLVRMQANVSACEREYAY